MKVLDLGETMKNLKKLTHRPFNSGFTLIELLIVMVIIGILATLGLVAYSYALKNARNARRIEDLNSIQSAFEQYYTATAGYNATCSTMAGSLQGGIPNNPSGGSYSPSCTATTYCVCAALEPQSGAAGSSAVKGGNASTACNSPTYTNSGSGNYYCVQNRQ